MDSVGFRRRRFRRGLCRGSLPSPDPARRSDAERRRRSTIPPERRPSLARRACKRTQRRARLGCRRFRPPLSRLPSSRPATERQTPRLRKIPITLNRGGPPWRSISSCLWTQGTANRGSPDSFPLCPPVDLGRLVSARTRRAPHSGAHDSAVPPKIRLALHAIWSPSPGVADSYPLCLYPDRCVSGASPVGERASTAARRPL